MASKGLTLLRYIDGVHIQSIRARLRKPKREAPGWSHDLHRLHEAYLKLEADYLELVERNRNAVNALRGPRG